MVAGDAGLAEQCQQDSLQLTAQGLHECHGILVTGDAGLGEQCQQDSHQLLA